MTPFAWWINGHALATDGAGIKTKFLTEEAPTSERTLTAPGWAHSGKPSPASD